MKKRVISTLSALAVFLLAMVPFTVVVADANVTVDYLCDESDAAYLTDAGTNLMADRLTVTGNMMNNVYTWFTFNHNGEPANSWHHAQANNENMYNGALTDGSIYGVTDTNAERAGSITVTDTNAGVNGGTATDTYKFVKIVFDLGESAEINRVLFGEQITGNGYGTATDLKGRMWQGTLYVGDAMDDTLFSDDAKQGEWSYLSEQDKTNGYLSGNSNVPAADGVVFDFATPVVGRYVGIYVPATAATGYAVRFSEIGIYGTEYVENVTVDYLCDESDAGYLTGAGTNLMADRLTATGNTLNNVYTWFTFNHNNEPKNTWHHAQANSENLYNGAMTDGSIYGVTDTNTEKAGSITVTESNGSVNGGTATDTYKFVKIVFDLGKSAEINRVLFGEQITGNGYGTTDLKGRMWQGTLYVGDAMDDTLFSDDAKQGEWSYLSEQDKKNGYLSGNSNVPAADGVVFNFNTPVTGRYVGIYVPASAAVNNQVRFSEIGIYGSYPSKLTNLGAAVRNADTHTGNEDYALRFGFTLDNTTVGYEADDPQTDNNYKRTDGTIVVGGDAYTVTDMGAILTLEEDYETALADPNALVGNTKDVKAVNLYNVEDGKITFTAVVTNVPYRYADVKVYARAYVQYENADGEEFTVMSDIIGRSVNDVLTNAEM